MSDAAFLMNASLAEFASRRIAPAQPTPNQLTRLTKFAVIVFIHVLVLYAITRETIQQRVMNVISAQIIAIDVPVPKPVVEQTQKPTPQKSLPAQRIVVAQTAPAVPMQSMEMAAVAPQIALSEFARSSPQESEPLVASAPTSHAPPPPPAPVMQPKIELPSSNADYLNNPAPPYPPQSKRLGEQGRVLLRVYVSDTGTPQHIELKQSSGYSRLDEVALATVMKWKFVAGRRNGVAEAMWVNVPVVFELA
ncbi:MAG: energy transducer TonB [Casimicrobium sp.]